MGRPTLVGLLLSRDFGIEYPFGYLIGYPSRPTELNNAVHFRPLLRYILE